MSQQNVEIVRLANEAWNRADVTAMLEYLDPDFEWWPRADDLEPELIRGHDATAARFADMDASAKLRVELEECIDAGECVVVVVHLVGRGRTSGAMFEERQAQAYRLRDGRITELRIYHEMSDALQAAGFESRAVSQENVEVLRRHGDAFNRRDLDRMLQIYAPDAEVDFSRSPGVEAGIYHGRQEIRDFWGTFFETWERAVASADEYIDCGETVVLPTRTHFWGRDGIEVEAYGVFVVTLRNGRIVEWRLFRERGEALKAVGLEE